MILKKMKVKNFRLLKNFEFGGGGDEIFTE